MKESVWMIQDAKNKFCKLIDSVSVAPQLITRRGEAVAVVVSYRDYRNHFSQHESFLDFMQRSPLRGSGLKIEQRKIDSRSREVVL